MNNFPARHVSLPDGICWMTSTFQLALWKKTCWTGHVSYRPIVLNLVQRRMANHVCNRTGHVQCIGHVCDILWTLTRWLGCLGFEIFRNQLIPPKARRSHRVGSLNVLRSSLGNHRFQEVHTWKPCRDFQLQDGTGWDRMGPDGKGKTHGKAMGVWKSSPPIWWFRWRDGCPKKWLTSRKHPSGGWWTMVNYGELSEVWLYFLVWRSASKMIHHCWPQALLAPTGGPYRLQVSSAMTALTQLHVDLHNKNRWTMWIQRMSMSQRATCHPQTTEYFVLLFDMEIKWNEWRWFKLID